MPRANRHFLPGHVWHITHRCHEKHFLLKFACDRRRYLRWIFEAKKRFGLSVLDYMVTGNIIHLLIKDTGCPNVIARSMQLIAGRTAQDYNQRKTRQGAFWEDRYHPTAIETDEHLHRCLVYIDLNMVRAVVVDHPVKWEHSGYHEIQQPPKRYAVIDLPGLVALCGFSKLASGLSTNPSPMDRSSSSRRLGGASRTMVRSSCRRVRWNLCVARTR
jgi:REP-associated tyrosine transposase